MNLLHMVSEYIARHARNTGEDVIQHLKAFAAEAHAKMTATAETVVPEIKMATETIVSEVETKAESVETAVHELETHAEGSFAHLLQSQSESKQ